MDQKSKEEKAKKCLLHAFKSYRKIKFKQSIIYNTLQAHRAMVNQLEKIDEEAFKERIIKRRHKEEIEMIKYQIRTSRSISTPPDSDFKPNPSEFDKLRPDLSPFSDNINLKINAFI